MAGIILLLLAAMLALAKWSDHVVKEGKTK
ncbi:MAG: signal peptide protein [Ectobacillus sp.]